MNMELKKERLLELLTDQTLFGLSKDELIELKSLQKEFPNFEGDNSFEKIALAISLSNLNTNEEMPHNLQATILRDADDFFQSEKVTQKSRDQKSSSIEKLSSTLSGSNSVFNANSDNASSSSLTQWLGWGVAALACIALVANIWITRTNPTVDVVANPTPTVTPKKEPTLNEQKQQLLASASDVVKSDVASPDATNKELKGEIVWSDEKQEGYMTFKGLAKNDVDKETYQLWIFRDEKLEPHPIDGGVFDVNKDGEVIIPINAKLKVKNPKVFAVTVEKPGGVVVSERGKIAALAKVQA